MRWEGLRNQPFIATLVAVVWLLNAYVAPAEHFDLIVHNGKIIDGTGNPHYHADVGIKNGRIAKIGNLADAAADKVIDAKGMRGEGRGAQGEGNQHENTGHRVR